MDPERVLKRFLVVSALSVGLVIGVAAVAGPDEASGPTRPAVTSGYSHEQLQRDAYMTQQMSPPNANTDSQFHASDAQLGRSQSPGYVGALEQHQADIDGCGPVDAVVIDGWYRAPIRPGNGGVSVHAVMIGPVDRARLHQAAPRLVGVRTRGGVRTHRAATGSVCPGRAVAHARP